MIGVRFSAGARNFYPYHRVQTDSGAHPASYSVCTGGFLPEVKAAGREAHHSPPSSAEIKECLELYLHSPIRLHGVVRSLAQGQLYLYLVCVVNLLLLTHHWCVGVLNKG
jgi:hypothetical protein